MGQEFDCRMHFRGRTVEGRAHLESDHVLFRGGERLKVSFKDVRSAQAAGGVLQLEFDGGPASFDLGKAAEKWADKILHPPSRLHKLGIPNGGAVALVGEFEADFLGELEDAGATLVTVKKTPAIVCFAAQKAAPLARIGKLADALPPKGALWVVYPKGVAAIREMEVLNAGRAAGLKDIKVAGFSSTQTALKFVK